MKKINPIFVIAAFLLFTLSACKKEDNNNYDTGEVSLDITNIVGNVNLDASGTSFYVTASGDSFSVTKFKYYLSNFELIKSDGSTYKIPESYVLINEADVTSFTPVFSDIPGGEYTGVKFIIGVDSAHNVSGAQSGALDPGNDMFWSWSTGYIFLKLEGTAVASPSGDFIYHIGGFSGANAAMRTVTLNFDGSKLIVDGAREAEIHIMTDVLEFFKNPDDLNLATTNLVMSPGATAMSIANRYQDMIKFDHIHNGN
ncbi:hypothetical protein BH11BAC2_BH11BAC2_23570 [soil metagenome]